MYLFETRNKYIASIAQKNTNRSIHAMKTWYELAREAMAAQNISQEQMAERLGVTQGGVGHWLNGRREPKLEMINRFLAELGLPPMAVPQADAIEVEPGPPITSPWRKIQIVGTAQMGTQGYWYAIENGDGYVEFPSRDPGAYALRLKGNSMAPAIKNGWVAVVEPNGQLIPGEYVMVRLHDGESMVKELLYANDVEVSLASVNDAYDRRTIPVEQIEHIHYVGAVCPPSKVKM